MRASKAILAKYGFAAYILVASCAVVTAQDDRTKVLPKQISGGILNGKAVSLPKPEYPASARAEKAGGQVNVQVLIDEEGNVVSAKAVSGPENAALRSAAETAALQARFSPTFLSGNPVKVSGVITYNFVLKEELSDGMNAFMAGTVLFLMKDIAADPANFAKALESDDLELRSMLKEAASDPDFPVLKPLSSLEATPADKRVELVEGVLEKLAGKLGAEHVVWKFELGRAFNDVLSPMMLAMLEGDADPARIDRSRMHKGLKVMKQMLTNAPAEVPKDLLSKLNALTEYADREDLLTEEVLPSFFEKVETLINAIAPE